MDKLLLDAVASVVKEYVSKTLADEMYELSARVQVLEARQPERGEKGEPGLNGLPGPAGSNGEHGRDGIDGKDGKDGIDGKDGRDGIDGKDGTPGADGRNGIDGKDGERGVDGRDGRDALQLEIMDGIDEARRYPRGAVASFRGGLVRSFRQTDPLAPGAELERCGWHVMVEGIASTSIDTEDDERTIVHSVTLTSGKTVEKRAKSPSPIDRGIWHEGAYDRGDVVTFGGSAWSAEIDSPPGKPGTPDSGWRLMVRKGRDAK